MSKQLLQSLYASDTDTGTRHTGSVRADADDSGWSDEEWVAPSQSLQETAALAHDADSSADSPSRAPWVSLRAPGHANKAGHHKSTAPRSASVSSGSDTDGHIPQPVYRSPSDIAGNIKRSSAPAGLPVRSPTSTLPVQAARRAPTVPTRTGPTLQSKPVPRDSIVYEDEDNIAGIINTTLRGRVSAAPVPAAKSLEVGEPSWKPFKPPAPAVPVRKR